MPGIQLYPGASYERALAIFETGIRFLQIKDITVSVDGETQSWSRATGLSALVFGGTVRRLSGTGSLALALETSADDVTFAAHPRLAALTFDSDDVTLQIDEDDENSLEEGYWRLAWTITGTAEFQIQNAGIGVSFGGLR